MEKSPFPISDASWETSALAGTLHCPGDGEEWGVKEGSIVKNIGDLKFMVRHGPFNFQMWK